MKFDVGSEKQSKISESAKSDRCEWDRFHWLGSRLFERVIYGDTGRYNTGYNIGVGGAVVRSGQLLLVRRASRQGHGNWQLPGGFIEPDETIEQAVVREVQEEAGVTAEVEAVLGLRSRYDPDSGNGIYVVMLLRPVSGEPTADGHEVDHAAYFTLNRFRTEPAASG
jgi:mutator protein MutT